MLTFVQLLKRVRKELNISQEQLARELHVSFSTVNRWENEKSNPNNIAKKVFFDFCKEKGIECE
ncbi:helix-turn-helix domain-containing protein [Clostridium algidicarnis]|uniref:helix-turn-helix domain-containing protein n=1 Tax=Clostridium algidicarnis TaxID=37659 RepID=UPI001C0E2276|nr:helix-turn-helix domain-containing protein [Clostridium algidicarnis]MBU3205362.1 helix-turn-helix domain-containing protein [Clostridium algidicarnis]